MIKMICPNCGKEYNEKMTCCISCGADLVPYESEVGQTSLEPSVYDVPAESQKPETAEKAGGFVREIPGHSPVPAEPVPPVPEEEPPLADEKKRFSLSGAARFAGSLTVSALMLVFIFLFSAASAVRLATSESRISRFAESLDVMSLPAAEAAIPSEGYGAAEDATVQEAIYAMSRGTGLSREDIRTIYEASTIKDFITVQLTEYADFIRSGKTPERLTADKLKGVFSENLGLIDETMGIPLSQHDINLAFSEIDSVQPTLEKLSPASLEKALGSGGLGALRLLSSLPVMICAAALAAAALPLLRTVNRGNAGMLRWGGAAALTGGAAVSAIVFLLTVQPVFPGDKALSEIVRCAAKVISPDLYRIGGALAVMGIIMLIWSATLKKAKSS